MTHIMLYDSDNHYSLSKKYHNKKINKEVLK